MNKINRSKLKVLIAEDNILLSNFYIEFLKDFYFKQFQIEYTICTDGENALIESDNSNFDLIIVDYMMPLLNGRELTEKIRQKSGPNQITPILVISGHDDTNWSNNLHIFENIKKPISPDTLYKACNRLLHKRLTA